MQKVSKTIDPSLSIHYSRNRTNIHLATNVVNQHGNTISNAEKGTLEINLSKEYLPETYRSNSLSTHGPFSTIQQSDTFFSEKTDAERSALQIRFY